MSLNHQKIIFLALLIALFPLSDYGQIGAEAQGGKLTLWTAIGIDQELSKNWMSVTDIGYGRHSDPDNNQFLKRQGLNVLTQDFIYKHKHWRFAFSFGYWRRNYYQETAPFNELSYPRQFRNEIRPFNRIYYDQKAGRIKITHVLRLDYRFYYNQAFSDIWPTPFEFRLRYMINIKIPVTKDLKNWLMFNDEILSALDKYSSASSIIYGTNWSPYQLTENRLSLYYRRSFQKIKVDLDIGVMYQYWRERPGSANFNNSLNLMVDLIIRDPFSKKIQEEEANEL